MTEALTEKTTGKMPGKKPRKAGRFAETFENAFTAFAAGRPASEPGFVRELRKAGMVRFAQLGLPTVRQEQWRSTDVSGLDEVDLALADPDLEDDPGTVLAEAVESLSYDGTDRLVFVDGRAVPALSRLSPLPEGAFAGSLAEALERIPEQVAPHLGRLARPGEHPFMALNTAFFRDGAFVFVPRGTVVERPIQLLAIASGPGLASFPRHLVVAAESSQVTLIESYVGLEGGGRTGPYLTCPVTEIAVGANATVHHYKVQSETHEAFHLACQESTQEGSSNLRSYSVSWGGGLVRNDVHAVLDAEGSDSILNGLYLVRGTQHVDNHMRVDHAKAHCTSHELYKGILEDRGRSVFNGLIHVHPDAQKTDAKQSNQNLLLSPNALANSNPQLEIFADDVRCTHGSTVGQLDDEAVFYLRSRGIGAEAARSLLTWAFASELVAGIRVEALRKDLEEFLFHRLPKGDVVRQAV